MREQISLIVTAFAVFSAACGGTAESPQTNRASNVNTPAQVSASPVAGIPPEVNNVNAAVPPGQANSNSRRKLVDTPATGQKPALSFRPSGENSETAVTMNKDGQFVEIRVFRDHPQFARIEATWIGLPLKELKFTLRNGSVITARTERLQNLQMATTAELAEIAAQ